MRLRMSLLVLVLALAVIATACSGDDDGGDATTTTADAAALESDTDDGDGTSSDSSGSSGASGTEENTSDATTTTVDLSVSVPEYSIVQREPGDEGDIVVVELDPESYDSLNDIDLQNVIADIVDEFPPVYEAYVIDSPDVAELVLLPADELDAEGQRLLDIHYLARLEEGFRIVYVGPFEDAASTILGS